MREKKTDRRVRRSRRMFRQAMRDLVMEKTFGEITVKEITERAGLRRATFYLHYQTKEDLLRSVLEEVFRTLVDRFQVLEETDAIGGRTHLNAYLVTFEHVAENAVLYQRLLAGSGGALVHEFIREHLAALVLASLSGLDQVEMNIPPEIVAQYVAGAELSLIIWWLNAEMPHTTQEMAMMTHQLVLRGVVDVLR